ncbi:MAG: hypothetical protein M8357_05390 [Desulfobulbaceae bacterium]|nr:hypothetical protein [Desulfobulbaceae bacterium]
MEQTVLKSTLPETGFLRLANIIGDAKASPPIPAIIPVSKSTWWAGDKSGRFCQLPVGSAAFFIFFQKNTVFSSKSSAHGKEYIEGNFFDLAGVNETI